MRLPRLSFVLLLFVCLVATPAAADHIFGIRGSVVGTDSGTHKVTISVTQYRDDYAGATETFGNSTASPYPQAIDWGDGVTLETGKLDYAGAGPSSTAKYSRQFMHTYPDNSNRTITLGSECCANSGFFIGRATNPSSITNGALTNTVQVAFLAPVPVLPNYGYPLLLLALLCAGAGTLLLRSESHSAGR